MLIIFIWAKPAALGTLGLVKGLVRIYTFSLYIFIDHLFLFALIHAEGMDRISITVNI